jgi:hypothetical protein
MAQPNVRVQVNRGERQQLQRALAAGVLNLMHAVETDAKREAPVRGGHRSFAPDGPVGGTLRRSIHAVTYLEGRPIAGSAAADENGQRIPDYGGGGQIVGIVGTNSGYGGFVELGTVKMPARAFLAPAGDKNLADAQGLITAGAKRFLGPGR